MSKRDIKPAHEVGWMEPKEVIQAYCELQGFVNEKVTQFRQPSDGFCHMCPSQTREDWNFHGGQVAYEFIVEAVREKLATMNEYVVHMAVKVEAFDESGAVEQAQRQIDSYFDVEEHLEEVVEDA